MRRGQRLTRLLAYAGRSRQRRREPRHSASADLMRRAFDHRRSRLPALRGRLRAARDHPGAGFRRADPRWPARCTRRSRTAAGVAVEPVTPHVAEVDEPPSGRAVLRLPSVRSGRSAGAAQIFPSADFHVNTVAAVDIRFPSPVRADGTTKKPSLARLQGALLLTTRCGLRASRTSVIVAESTRLTGTTFLSEPVISKADRHRRPWCRYAARVLEPMRSALHAPPGCTTSRCKTYLDSSALGGGARGAFEGCRP